MDSNPNSYLVSQQENTETDVKPHIPTELFYDILHRLPVKSLLRFKCVSQSFCAIIDSPKFVNMQLNTSSVKKIPRQLIFTESASSRGYKTRAFYVFDIDGGLEDKAVFQNQQRRKLLLCNSVNGLALLFDEYSNVVLWNPSTGQHRNLPLPYDDSGICRMGLGYDSVGDDCKVVLIHQGSVWIFELRSNSWRRIEIDHVFLSYLELFWSSHAILAHGNLHWLYNSPRTGSQTIIAFDVAKEKFYEVSCPIAGYYMTGLHVLDGCLCISFFSLKGARLYVRKKDGDDYTWCKLYSVTSRLPKFLSIESFMNVKVVVGYLKGGNKILLDLRLEYMVLYDLEKKSFKQIGFTDFVDRYTSVELTTMYEESLVSVGVEEQEDENEIILSG